MLSIWKLVRSSSISGLSYTTNPNCSKIAAISRIASMLGWSVPRRIGRPGVVTSTASARRRASSSLPRRAVPRSASAASIAWRTVLAIAPTFGRSRPAARRCRAGPPSAGPSCRGRRARAPRASRASGAAAIARQRFGPKRLEVAGQVGEVHSVLASYGDGVDGSNPRPSATSRVRAVERPGGSARRSSPLRRCDRRSRCRGRRGRRGSCGRSGCRRA